MMLILIFTFDLQVSVMQNAKDDQSDRSFRYASPRSSSLLYFINLSSVYLTPSVLFLYL